MDPENMVPPEVPAPEPQAEANPWDQWQQAGLDPTAFDPHEVRNAAQFFNALKNPDQRQYALSAFAAQLRDEERGIFAGQQQDDDEPYYGDPGEEEYGYEGAGLDPSAIEQIVEKRLAAFQQEQAAQRQQEAYQQEFERELLRATADGYDDNERVWIASTALNLRQSDPYSTTGQLVDNAREQYDAAVQRRLQQAAQRQQQVNADVSVPNGQVPSPHQVPRSPEEAMQQYLQRAQG